MAHLRILPVLIGILAMAPLTAQQGRGTIQGLVTDPTGAAVPDARVTITHAATHVTETTPTNGVGRYLVSNLNVGAYTVSVTKEGFKKLERSGITIEVGQSAEVDVSLQTGSTSESIVVTAEAPLVDVNSATVGNVVERQGITNLPINGRFAFDFVLLTPGAVNESSATASSFTNRWSNQSYLSVNGGPTGANSFLIDGIFSADPYLGYLNVNPTVDAIQEFKVESGTMPADYGYTLGGIINVATRSGTDQLHGSVYEFVRNSDFDANNWGNNRVGQSNPPLRYNQFGSTLSGPVKIPRIYNGLGRTFFFLNYEGFRYAQATTGLYSLPTAAMHTGDFSQLEQANCAQVVLYDPATTASNPNKPGFYMRTPFPGNIIPQSKFDPVGKNVAQFYPLPNTTPSNACANTNNYYGAATEHRSTDQVTYRLDHHLSQKNSLFLRHMIYHQWRDNGASNLYPDPLVRERMDPVRDHNIVLSDVHIFSPSLVHEFRIGLNRGAYRFTVASNGQNMPQTLGLPAIVPQDSFPGISDGLTGFQTGTIGSRGTEIWQMYDAVSITRGRHSIKAGADLWLTQGNAIQETAPSGNYNFPATLTGNPDPSYTGPNGNGFATLLLGAVGSATATSHLGAAQVGKSYNFFVQDNVKVSRRLTLNLGLRYSLQQPPFERNNGTSRFSLAVNPLTNLPGETQYMGVDFPRVHATNKTDFGPRFGFAYDLRGNQKTVLRGGYSIFYEYDFSASLYDFGDTNGFATTTTSYNSSNSNYPAFLFSQGLPGPITQPQGAKLGPNLAFSSQDFNLYEYDATTPRSQQWNLSLQQQLSSSVVLDITYSGNHGTHLVADPYTMNSLNPQYYSLGNQLLQQVANPYAGKVPGTQGAATVTQLQTLLPWANLGGVTNYYPHLGNSIYHALYATVQKRLSKGLVLLSSFAYSKQIADSVNASLAQAGGAAGNWALGYQNGAYNRAAERGIDPSNVPQRSVTSATYELPFGRGSGWRKTLIGGWQTNGILTLSRGLPLVVRGANNQLANRPNLLRNPTLPANYADTNPAAGVLWFDPSAFVNPPNWTFGNTPKTLSQLFAPGTVNLDFSLFKNFKIRERTQLQFRAETFNTPNHVNLLAPNTTFGANLNSPGNTNALFGRITTAADPRKVQFALKLTF